ncbi:MFS transporter [Staphylococcus aureus]|nr:MFS transporter [Staphylococcus aureus]MBH4540330.1 MFS transporter [Staphylococcus aureus]MBH4545073.1 MFS transporter [Staphylococcus aureus]MBH4551767.1 MFS transporter [Staphylococcus aureus]MBH4554312.1 MFS transporter [Staphylococcus aureus]
MYHTLQRSVIWGTTLVRTLTFICIPFIVIKLTNSNISPTIIGLLLGCGWLFGIIGGYLISYLSDALGRKKLMTMTLFLWSLVFLLFLINQSIITMFILNITNGLCRAFHDPITQSIISDSEENEEKKKKLFHKRYLSANVGGAIGPLIGGFISGDSVKIVFLISFLLLFIYAIINMCIQYPETQKVKTITIKKSLSIVKKDTKLQLIVYSALFISVGVALVDLFPTLLKGKFINTQFFSYLLTVNALTVLLLQPIIASYIVKLREKQALLSGCLIFTLGLLIISISPSFWLMVIGMFIFTIGEIIVLPTGSILIDNIAPTNLVGTYYGAYNFRTFGNFLTPIIVGLLISSINVTIVFSAFSLITLLSFLFYVIFFNLNTNKTT